MPYSEKIIAELKKLPASSIGVRLGRWAVYHDLSVAKLALATGATRQSVYNWLRGGKVLPAYQPRILQIIEHMQSAEDADDAWRKICKAFDLSP